MPTIVSISQCRTVTKAKITTLETELLASQLNSQDLRDERKRLQSKLQWADTENAEAKYNEQLTPINVELEAVEKKIKTLEDAIGEQKVHLRVLEGMDNEKDLFMQTRDGMWEPVPNQISPSSRRRSARELAVEQADLAGEPVNPIARMNAELERSYSELLVRIQAYSDELNMDQVGGAGFKESEEE